MAKWWKFGLGKKTEEPAAAPPESPAPAPAPEPVREPAPAPEPVRESKPGLFARLFGRAKKGMAEQPEEQPEREEREETPAPEEVDEGVAGPPPAPPREYPPFLHVSASGIWVISDTEWEGTMSGTLHGADVREFIDAMEAEDGPKYGIAIPLIADAYGIPGHLINMDRSGVYSVTY
ncbi:hypothetical protein ACF08W_34600 [Streptomyces sp. NPDC015144]|uniref:hypothetical protein n=1 Tax=Streptomyces sp. NPDC015144 TaxID=3364944 RepID=UPI0036FC9F23